MQQDRTHRHGFLSLSESRSATTDCGVAADLLLVVSNAEQRSIEILKAQSLQFTRAVVLYFDPVNRLEERQANFDCFMERLKHHSDSVESYALGSIVDYNRVFEKIQALIIRERQNFGRPFSIAIDISCLPKHYMIYCLGLCFKFAIAHNVKLFYAETTYGENSGGAEISNSSPIFSVGQWEAIIIPFFEGELVLESRSRLIALLGFETLEASRFIHSYQADQYSIIMALASFNQAYAERAYEEGCALARDFDVPDNLMFSADAGSALSVLSIFADYFSDDAKKANQVVCLGPKPHAVGAALHALVHENFSMICRVPTAYPEFYTAPDGNSWIFDIVDLSSTFPISSPA